MTMMTSRERVEAALNHREADRVPLDLWGSACRIHTGLYLDLIKRLGFAEPGPRLRPGTTTEYVDYRLSDRFHVDFRHVNVGKPDAFVARTGADGTRFDEWGVGRRDVGGFLAITQHPLADAEAADLERYPWPRMRDEGRRRHMAGEARDWYENTSFAITPTTPASGLYMEFGDYLRGMENFLCDFYAEPEFSHKLIGILTDLFIELYTFILEPIADYVAWVEITEDYGMQHAPFISPEIFRAFLKEPHLRLFRAIKKTAPKCKIFFHSCGAVRTLIPDFIDMGVDILNSLQPLAAGMDSFELKREFGKDLVFHGGIDLQQAMRGSRQDVEDEVKRRIDAFAPGGGYIFAPSNHLIADVPAENVIALYDTAYEYGKY